MLLSGEPPQKNEVTQKGVDDGVLLNGWNQAYVTGGGKSTTSGEEGADHEAETDGRDGVHEQKDEDQCGVAVRQHRSVWAHLKKIKSDF